jgi:serine/threonine protein kinase
LKPGNILLDENFNVKLCDFGEAKIIKNIPKTDWSKSLEFKKTRNSMPVSKSARKIKRASNLFDELF